MKKALLIFTLCVAALGFATKAEAKFSIPITFGAEKIMTVVDLPNDSTTYVSKEASISGDGFDMGFSGYCNVGYFYKQVSILWIPLWNYDGQYCVVPEGQVDTYYTLSDEAAQQMKEKYNLPDNPIRFWHKIGGKIFFPLLIIGLIAWGANRKKKKEEEANSAE